MGCTLRDSAVGLCLIACLIVTAAFAQEFKLGSQVTDFTLTDVRGSEVHFASLKGATTVVVFMSTKCPISNSYIERMNALSRDFSAKGVKFVFINANFNESPAEMVEHAASHGLTFPVYKDPEGSVSDRFGATVTPETFLVVGDTIRYHGAIDDSANPARVKKQGLRQALDAVRANHAVETVETKAFGCTIKRRKKAS